MLVTYYIRAKQTDDSLTVHYRLADKNDDGSYKYYTEDFYSYYITVNNGVTFSSEFTFNDGYTSIANALSNNTVVNKLNVTIKAEPDLTKLSQLSAYFAYTDYKMVGAERSADGKEVFLYYHIDDDPHDYVVDFGSSIAINATDIIMAESGWDSVDVVNNIALKYGKAVLDESGAILTYTPNSIIQGKEQIVVNVNKTVDGELTHSTHYINIYPATNVLYEETVMTEQNLLGVTDPANKWEKLGTSTVGNQQLEVLNNDGTTTNVYGYDSVYAEDTGFSGDTYYKATLTATDKQAATDTALSFTFTGTGFDLISECGPQTGSILVRLSVLNDDGTKTLKKGYYVDTYFVGDGTIINSADADANGVLDYQVPVVRDLNLAYGTYVADVYGYVYPKSTASANSVGKMVSAESIVSEALDSLGFNDSVEMYEISYMDENSVLNGGTGISEMSVVKDKDVYTSDVISDNMMSAYMYENLADEKNETASTTGYVYVDGVRVYGTMSTTLDNADGYKAEERGTKYYNVYDFVNTSVNDLDSLKNNFAVYVEHDGNTGVYTIKDYKNMGPKNEVYLTDGSAIAFIITGYEPGNQSKYTVQVSMKAVQGESNVLVSKDDKTDNEIPVYANTEMYYTVPVRTATLTDSGDTIDYVLIEVPEDANDNVVISISGIKVSNNIKPVSDVETLGEILVNEASGTFSPEVFSVKKIESVKSKRKFTVSVSTSTDANKILVTVDGAEYTLTPTNTSAVEIGATKIYSYSTSIRAPEKTADKTTFTVSVVACSTADNNVQSDPVTMTVTIK